MKVCHLTNDSLFNESVSGLFHTPKVSGVTSAISYWGDWGLCQAGQDGYEGVARRGTVRVLGWLVGWLETFGYHPGQAEERVYPLGGSNGPFWAILGPF